MTTISLLQKYTVVPVDGLSKKKLFEGLTYCTSWSPEIIPRLSSALPHYFESVIGGKEGDILSFNSSSSRIPYRFVLPRGVVQGEVSVYDDLHDLQKSGLKLEESFSGQAGFVLAADYLWRGKEKGVRFNLLPTRLYRDVKEEEVRALMILLQSLVEQKTTLDTTMLSGEKNFFSMRFYDESLEIAARVRNPTVERVRQLDAPLDEFMGWLEDHHQAIKTMSVYLGSAVAEFEKFGELQEWSQVGDYLPLMDAKLQDGINRYVSLAQEIYSRLTPPRNNRMDYLCSN